VAKKLLFHQMRLVYEIPGMDQAHVQRDVVYRRAKGIDLKLDVYAPAKLDKKARLAGVVFIHGGPISQKMQVQPKDWGCYISWGQLAAASGLVGVTFNHRFYGYEHLEQAGSDVAAAIEYVREHARAFNLDPTRLCLAAFSGGGPFLSLAFRDRPRFVRCVAIYYAMLDLRSSQQAVKIVGQEAAERFSPAAYLGSRTQIPILIARAGLEKSPQLNQALDRFAHAALEANVPLDLLNHPRGQHGFDVLDDDERSRYIIARTLEFIQANV
jgi:acetyl esterase/lipase